MADDLGYDIGGALDASEAAAREILAIPMGMAVVPNAEDFEEMRELVHRCAAHMLQLVEQCRALVNRNATMAADNLRLVAELRKLKAMMQPPAGSKPS